MLVIKDAVVSVSCVRSKDNILNDKLIINKRCETGAGCRDSVSTKTLNGGTAGEKKSPSLDNFENTNPVKVNPVEVDHVVIKSSDSIKSNDCESSGSKS